MTKTIAQRLIDIADALESAEENYCPWAADDLRKIAEELPAVEPSDVRRDLVAGIYAAANGDMAKADAILDKYVPNRPKLPDLRRLSYDEMCAIITGTSENRGGKHE